MRLWLALALLLAPGVCAAHAGELADRYSGYVQAQTALLQGDDDAALEGYLRTLGYGQTGGVSEDEWRARSLQLALLAGDVETAVQLSRTLPPHPKDPTLVWLVRLAAAAKDGNAAEALAWAERLRNLAPELVQFDLLKAYAERGRGVALESTIKQMGAVPREPSQAARFWYHIARMAAQIGDFDAATQAAAKAASLEPNALFSTMLMADLLRLEGETAAAEKLLKAYRDANPSLALMGLGDGGLAAPTWHTGMAGDMASVLFDFGVMVWAQGGETPARQLLNLALWLAPEQVYARYYSGIVEEFGGYLKIARERFAALVNDPMVGLAAQLRVAEIDFKLGEQRQAYDQLRTLLRRYPNEPSLLRARGEMAFEMEDFREAERMFERVWATLPDNAGVNLRAQLAYMIGAAAERQGKYAKAADWLKTSLTLLPENPAVLNYLGYMWVEQGTNVEEAFTLLQAALVLAPEDGAITDSVGWAYFMRGNLEAAERYVERAAEMEPDDPTIMEHLGDIYAKAGRVEEARWQWGRALDVITETPEKAEDMHMRRDLERKLRRGR